MLHGTGANVTMNQSLGVASLCEEVCWLTGLAAAGDAETAEWLAEERSAIR
jgi:adenylylsulfate kinase-like enzyme